jgi:hypothetical protein
VPDFLAGGAREVLVPASQEQFARVVLPRADEGPLEPVSAAVGVPVRVLAGILSAVALIPTLL